MARCGPSGTTDGSARIDVNATLTTTGRKTGKARSVPLYAFEDGANLVIVGSWAGRPRDPAWVGNLRAEPRATIRIGRESRPIRAREVEVPSAERDRLWALVTEAFRYYATYQRKTTRVIPLFVLEPDTQE
jgi:F420H(2)-dependent quinone reductase